MSQVEPLSPDVLYQRCDPEAFSFTTTAELEEPNEVLGQQRALEALRFGLGMARDGYNLFALGPPGLGKTTLASVIANEMAAHFKPSAGPLIQIKGDLTAILTNLEGGDIFFIDEIHRLNPAVEEILYPAMEEFELDLIIGEGPAARSVRLELRPFTLVGATTRAGLIGTPLRERFGIPLRLDFYEPHELEQIVRRGARVLGAPLADDGAVPPGVDDPEVFLGARGGDMVIGEGDDWIEAYARRKATLDDPTGHLQAAE